MAAPNPQLRARANPGELIDHDLPCLGCGYNLKGLHTLARCPECRRAISGQARPTVVADDTLTEAPPSYLRLLSIGCMLMMVGSIATLALLRHAWLHQSQAWSLAAASAAILWLAGVFVVTEPRRSNSPDATGYRREWRRTRWLVRGLSLAWLAAVLSVYTGIRMQIAGLASLSAGLGPGLGAYTRYTDAAAGLAALIGVAACIPLCLMLTTLADWARNDSLGERFRGAALALFFGGLVLLVCQGFWGRAGPLNFVFVVARVFGGIAFFGGLIVFLFSTVQLAGTAIWAVRNAHEAGEIAERRAERRARQLERDLATVPLIAKTALAPEHTPSSPPRGRDGRPIQHGPVRERPTNLETYDLADDDPSTTR